MADVEVVPRALGVFATNAKGPMRPDLSQLMPLLQSSSSSRGTMPESGDLDTADKAACKNLQTYFTGVDRVVMGIGATAGRCGTRWQESTQRVAGGFQQATVNQPGLPSVDPAFDAAAQNDRITEQLTPHVHEPLPGVQGLPHR